MTTYKVTFKFYIILDSVGKKTVKDDHVIEGNSVLDCSRKAFMKKRDLEHSIGKEVLYTKKNIKKVKDDDIPEEEKIDSNYSSDDMYADEAIKFIKNNDLEYLKKIEFMHDEEDRSTVIGAYNKKQNKE